jgi:hypothetical protein
MEFTTLYAMEFEMVFSGLQAIIRASSLLCQINSQNLFDNCYLIFSDVESMQD